MNRTSPVGMAPITIATADANKAGEFRDMLTPLGVEIRTLLDLPNPPEIEETGATFRENALIKARALHQFTGAATLADDSGLVVDALNGRPGVHSARYAGIGGPGRDSANCRKLLAELARVGAARRTARFVCVLAYLDDHGAEHLFEGTCEGLIGLAARGENGFGYDPVFELPDRGKTMAELSSEEKHALSHRGHAMRKFVTFLLARG